MLNIHEYINVEAYIGCVSALTTLVMMCIFQVVAMAHSEGCASTSWETKHSGMFWILSHLPQGLSAVMKDTIIIHSPCQKKLWEWITSQCLPKTNCRLHSTLSKPVWSVGGTEWINSMVLEKNKSYWKESNWLPALLKWKWKDAYEWSGYSLSFLATFVEWK